MNGGRSKGWRKQRRRSVSVAVCVCKFAVCEEAGTRCLLHLDTTQGNNLNFELALGDGTRLLIVDPGLQHVPE